MTKSAKNGLVAVAVAAVVVGAATPFIVKGIKNQPAKAEDTTAAVIAQADVNAYPVEEDTTADIISQILGGIAAAACLYLIFKGTDVGGFASNGYGEHSPEHYGFTACAVTEVLLTAFFLIIIHGATDKRAPAGFAPIAIGLGLTLIHLISIPVTNTSVNPARSIAVALFAEPWALEQVWFFIVFPIIGGVLGGFIYRFLLESKN